MGQSPLLLTPFMEIALRTMRRSGPLEYDNGGWRSPDGKRFFNSHTMGWLAGRGNCQIDADNRATITQDGIRVLSFAERVAA